MQKINLGCGTDIKPGWLNVDLVQTSPDVMVWDLNNTPYPIDDESSNEVQAVDVLEHLLPGSLIPFIEECHRIMAPGGTLFIQTPRYDADFLWIDPTHVRGFHERSMDFFDPDTPFGKSTGFYSQAKFKVEVETLANKNLRFWMVKR